MALSARLACLFALGASALVFAGCLAPAVTADASVSGRDRDRDDGDEGDDEEGDGELKQVGFDEGCEDRATAFDQLVARVDAERVRQNLPGAAVAVVCRGKHVFAAGVGETQRGSGSKVTAQTRFNYASITKSLVATTAVRLAKRGKIDLDGPVSAQIPGLGHAPYARPFTWSELLAHSAGYPTTGTSAAMDADQRVRESLATQLWSPPGAVHNYTNEGYLIAGYGLQQAAATPLRDLLEREVLRRAQMTNATLHPDLAAEPGTFAFGHADGTLVGPNDMYLGTTYYTAMGGAWGSAEDLARFAHQLMAKSRGNLVDDDGFRQMTTPKIAAERSSSWGLGLEITPRGDFLTVSHSGGAPGFNTYLMMVPSEGFAVVLLTNGNGFLDLADEAFTRVTGKTLGDETVVPPGAGDAAAAAGAYQSAALGSLQVTATADGNLQLFLASQNRTTTLTRGNMRDHYFGAVDPSLGEETVRFVREGGTIKYLVSLAGVGSR